MTGKNQKEILKKIQDTYVPFLQKFIAFLESKRTAPTNLSKVKAVYTIFTTASPDKQVETFRDNKKNLEDWYNKAEKKKRENDVSDDKSAEDETVEPPAKKRSTKSKGRNQKLAENSSTPAEEPLVFACAACPFSSEEEGDFIKHVRTEHRSEFSMWCKQCEKYFINVSLLVTHIKGLACVKEEMVYQCGAKDCSFETASGQAFIHHLRQNHEGFLFCIHCQKYFIMPQCLLLHMEDECQFKDKFRKSGVNGQPASVAKSAPNMPVPTMSMMRPQVPAVTKAPASSRGRASTVPTRAPLSLVPSSKSRGRGRGKTLETVQPPAKKRSTKSKGKNQKLVENNSTSAEEPLVFACASCQFLTEEDEEFIKHTRADHRLELSLWCKQCGKCFSSASLLVPHIKSRACVKEEMVYQCGAKDCSFEAVDGQTFVYHLRHTHKELLFCFHCQKWFTVPHCLILHMQNECQFKDKFRKSGVNGQPTAIPKSASTMPAPAMSMIRPEAPAVAKAPASRRGRVSTVPTKGRGRGRSNDVEDVDDQGYCPKTLVADTGVRRSGRRAVQ